MKKTLMVVAALTGCGVFSFTARADNRVIPGPLAWHESELQPLEEVHITGETENGQPSYKVPATSVDTAEMDAINLSTIEDAIAYQPSLSVRRRYIGDANGSLGIRGSNVFQTARTLVYADNLPLHYHLQTRWSGAPRWSLIAPNEVESIDIIYGPFSAAYPGNAMGGVVQVHTRVPDQRRVELEGAIFSQDYKRLSTDEHYNGGRWSASYEDKLGHLTLLAFYNHLENESQPMDQYFAQPLATNDENVPQSPTSVEGGLQGVDNHERPVFYYGDSGPDKSVGDLFKLKTGYEWQRVQLTSTIAYEERSSDTSRRNNFLHASNGAPFWGGLAEADGHAYTIRGSNFAEQEQERNSLLLGLGLQVELASEWTLDLDLSRFDLLKDSSVRSSLNPADPAFTGTGRATEYDDTGWTTVDIKASTDALAASETMGLSVGLHHSHYQMAINSFDIDNWNGSRNKTSAIGSSGGETITQAVFAQYAWQLTPYWDLTLGGRYEHWQAQNGYLDGQQHPDRSASGFSPKFSLGYAPDSVWQLRYSLARALRFPLVEELYHNENRADVVQQANAQLAPEDGIHHNLMAEMALAQGFLRLNIFKETIEDTIFDQLGIVNGTEISTFLGIDEVDTQGAEFIVDQPAIWQTPVDLRFNVSYLDSEITKNTVNPAIEGKELPRLPRWQANILLTYKPSHTVALSSGLRYASNSFAELDNTDTATQTFGALDSYLFLNLKADWQVNPHLKFAVGADNVTNTVAYVHHPWPSRTLYLETNYVF